MISLLAPAVSSLLANILVRLFAYRIGENSHWDTIKLRRISRNHVSELYFLLSIALLAISATDGKPSSISITAKLVEPPQPQERFTSHERKLGKFNNEASGEGDHEHEKKEIEIAK